MKHVLENLMGYGGTGAGSLLFSIGIASAGGGLIGFIIPLALWVIIGSIVASLDH